MPWTPMSDREIIRRNFSLSRVVKRNNPGKESREDLTWKLSPHYQDALFATPENPIEIQNGTDTLQLFPTRKNAKKIRVQVKR
jgi:hypothetical protein